MISSRNNAYYRCSASSRGSLDCPGVRVTAPIIEEGIRSSYLGMVGHLPAFLRTETLDAPEVDSALSEIALELKEAASQIVRPGADVATLAARVSELQVERERLASVPRERRVVMRDLGATWAEVFEAADLATQRRYLAIAFDHFTMHPRDAERRVVGYLNS